MKILLRDAAEHAQVTTRTIWNWLRQYKLTKYTLGNETAVDLGELNAVIDADTRAAPTPQLLAVIVRRLEKLERDLEVLLYAGGYSSALQLSPEQALLTYQVAEQQSKRETFTETDVEDLTVMLNGVTEEIIEMIQVQTDVPHPWVCFWTLAARLQQHLRTKKKYETDLGYQRLYMELTSARHRLRDIALVFIEADTDETSRNILYSQLGEGNAMEMEILRRVLWKKTTFSVNHHKLSDDPQDLLREALTILETTDDTVASSRRIVRRLEHAIAMLKAQK